MHDALVIDSCRLREVLQDSKDMQRTVECSQEVSHRREPVGMEVRQWERGFFPQRSRNSSHQLPPLKRDVEKLALFCVAAYVADDHAKLLNALFYK